MADNVVKKAVILLSGGLDSTVTLHKAQEQGFECYALTVNYEQRHAVEIQAAKRVVSSMPMAGHKIINLDLRAFGGSSLTGNTEVPKGESPVGSGAIPNTYVPARNTIFLSLALCWAEVLGSRDIFIGVSAVDYSGYPDCRPEFIKQFEALARIGTKAGDLGVDFTIHTPLISLSKAETVVLGTKLGVNFELTH